MLVIRRLFTYHEIIMACLLDRKPVCFLGTKKINHHQPNSSSISNNNNNNNGQFSSFPKYKSRYKFIIYYPSSFVKVEAHKSSPSILLAAVVIVTISTNDNIRDNLELLSCNFTSLAQLPRSHTVR
jgi:hypothetical protein